jgi:hypothetical protein
MFCLPIGYIYQTLHHETLMNVLELEGIFLGFALGLKVPFGGALYLLQSLRK